MSSPTPRDVEHLHHAIRLAAAARDRGDHPFGSVIVAPDGTVVEGLNSVVSDRDPTGHAETNAVRRAGALLDEAALRASVLYTSTEPCAMCAGAIYWSGISRIVYALGEDELRAMVDAEGLVPTLAMPSREVLARGGRPIEVTGPVEIPQARTVHGRFWAASD